MRWRHGLLVLWCLFLMCRLSCPTGAWSTADTHAHCSPSMIAELYDLASATKQLATPEEVPKLLNSILQFGASKPQRTFEVSSEWLRQNLNEWQRKPSGRDSGPHLRPAANSAFRSSLIPGLLHGCFPEASSAGRNSVPVGNSKCPWTHLAGPVQTTSVGTTDQLTGPSVFSLRRFPHRQCSGLRK